MSNTKSPSDCRWGDEIAALYKHLGYEVVDFAGTSDYQGGGCFLLSHKHWYRGTEWLTLSYGYGSCSGCDPYEDEPAIDNAAAWLDLATKHPDEATARKAFAEATSRQW